MPRKTSSVINADIHTIESTLRSLGEGSIATYDELSSLIERDVQKEGRFVMNAARDILQRDHNIIFECIRNIGLKRLKNEEIILAGEVSVRRARNTVVRGQKKLNCIDPVTLPQDMIPRFLTALSYTATIAAITHKRVVEHIQRNLTGAKAPLPIEKTLELFSLAAPPKQIGRGY